MPHHSASYVTRYKNIRIKNHILFFPSNSVNCFIQRKSVFIILAFQQQKKKQKSSYKKNKHDIHSQLFYYLWVSAVRYGKMLKNNNDFYVSVSASYNINATLLYAFCLLTPNVFSPTAYNVIITLWLCVNV